MDLGASWIHGSWGNPLADLAKRAGARTLPTRYKSSIEYDTNGQSLPDAKKKKLREFARRITAALKMAQSADRDESVETVVRDALNWEQRSEADCQMLNFILNSTLEHEFAGSASALSAHWYDAGLSFRGDDLIFPDGYSAISDHLSRGLVIKLGERVQRVSWEKAGSIVLTDQGKYHADHVIVTLPLGVLKANNVVFEPGLPEKKQRAITALGMGVLNKCFLRFRKAFWPTEFDWMEYVPAEMGLWVEWVNFSRLSSVPILLGFNAADVGRKLENWTDQRIVESAMETLRTIFGTSIPDPIAYQITRWASDPYALGSYSFNALGSRPRMRDDLASSIGGRIFFAGEATSQQYPGTVHGAYLSGLRVAREIRENPGV
jgi:predicted NAD/FAD-dependent oxidoreductase